MKVFVSGATGFIGIQLVKRLAGMGIQVHALYRSEEKANLIRIEGVSLFKGDILDEESLYRAMEGCEQAYHAAAFAAVWARDPDLVFRLNVDGAMNVIRTAARTGTGKIVITSTAGILGPSTGEAVNEASPAPSSFFTTYEASKFRLEQILSERSEQNPEVVIVNPTRVFGPGYLSESNGVTKMIKQYVEGRWRFIPGNGLSSGNYVFVEDVVTGHLLAMEKGKPGERYVLGGENATYIRFFQYISELSGVTKRLFRVPLWIMLAVSMLLKGISVLTGKAPLIVPSLVRKFNHNWIVSSQRARVKLGYDPVSLEEGLARTLEWIKTQHIDKPK